MPQPPASPTAPAQALGDLAVIVVTYDAADVIAGCLESLMALRAEWGAASGGARLRVLVVDNASKDDTCDRLRNWAAGTAPFVPDAPLPFSLPPAAAPYRLIETDHGPAAAPDPEADVTLIHSGANRGFAGGVNAGLAAAARDPAVAHFWVLNPDSMAAPGAARALAQALAETPGYGMIGGRVIFLDRPDTIQIDGGLLNRWTGVTGNYNLAKPVSSPPPASSELDFIMGASLIASRGFYDAIGPMQEDYFLYYEEVDWAQRRGDWPLVYARGLNVYHWGGTAIGSPVIGRRASPFSLYFKHRARLRFQRRFHPLALPVAWAYSLAQAARTATLRRDPAGAWAILAGSFGLPAPRAVTGRLSPEAMTHAFSKAG